MIITCEQINTKCLKCWSTGSLGFRRCLRIYHTFHLRSQKTFYWPTHFDMLIQLFTVVWCIHLAIMQWMKTLTNTDITTEKWDDHQNKHATIHHLINKSLWFSPICKWVNSYLQMMQVQSADGLASHLQMGYLGQILVIRKWVAQL